MLIGNYFKEMGKVSIQELIDQKEKIHQELKELLAQYGINIALTGNFIYDLNAKEIGELKHLIAKLLDTQGEKWKAFSESEYGRGIKEGKIQFANSIERVQRESAEVDIVVNDLITREYRVQILHYHEGRNHIGNYATYYPATSMDEAEGLMRDLEGQSDYVASVWERREGEGWRKVREGD